jgi:hypothetical protein
MQMTGVRKRRPVHHLDRSDRPYDRVSRRQGARHTASMRARRRREDAGGGRHPCSGAMHITRRSTRRSRTCSSRCNRSCKPWGAVHARIAIAAAPGGRHDAPGRGAAARCGGETGAVRSRRSRCGRAIRSKRRADRCRARRRPRGHGARRKRILRDVFIGTTISGPGSFTSILKVRPPPPGRECARACPAARACRQARCWPQADRYRR